MNFAKIFETAYGQAVVMVQPNDDGAPEIRFFIKPQNYDVCSMAFGFEDSEEGWLKAEAGFKKIDIQDAVKAYETTMKMMGYSPEDE